jgi:hypothetical protein
LRQDSLFVTIGGQPHYRLDVRPAGGKYTCAVTQTENGRRLDAQATFNSIETALEGGLNDLRSKLGW